MIKIDIVKQVATELNLKDREALAVVDTIIDSIKDAICEHDRMEIRNFGVFQVKQRKPRTGRNPRNKKEYPILPRKVVTFKLGKELKDFAIDGPEVMKSAQPAGRPRKAEASPAVNNPEPPQAPPREAFEQPSFLDEKE